MNPNEAKNVIVAAWHFAVAAARTDKDGKRIMGEHGDNAAILADKLGPMMHAAMNAADEQRFPIGTTYTTKRKVGGKIITREHTVIDCLKTYNSAGEMVGLRYLATHPFAGQEVTDYDVSDTTIAMNDPRIPE